jgi:ABC-type amino acid transport substrate-binding protein
VSTLAGGRVGRWQVLSAALTLICLLASCRRAPPDEVWQRIQEQGVLRVGMEANWVPFEYVDGAGQLAGFDVELARELGTRLELELQFVANLSFDGLYDALTAGRTDVVISAVVVDLARSADFAFSTPYFDAGQVLVVGPDNDDIEAMQDLRGRVLAVELGSDGDAVARRWARRLADLLLLHTDSAEAALGAVAQGVVAQGVVAEGAVAQSAVAEGQADAALIDRASALIALKAKPGTALHIRGEPVTDEQYAVVVHRESAQLLRAVNATLADLRRDGTLEALERKWLGP